MTLATVHRPPVEIRGRFCGSGANMRGWMSIRFLCGGFLVLVALAGCGGGSASVLTTGSTGSTAAAVVKHSALTVSGTPASAVSAGQTYSFTPTVSTSGGTPTYSISNAPPWATFNTSTGQLSGTPPAGDAGTYSGIVISVTDGSASASLPAFSITVAEANSATGSADVSWTPPTTNTNGSTLTNLAGYTIYYGTSATALTQTVQVANIGVTNYVISGLTSGTWYFAVTAYTNAGAQSALSNIASKTIT